MQSLIGLVKTPGAPATEIHCRLTQATRDNGPQRECNYTSPGFLETMAYMLLLVSDCTSPLLFITL